LRRHPRCNQPSISAESARIEYIQEHPFMAQSLSQLWIHIIFSTKGRYPFLIKSIQQHMYEQIKKTCDEQNCKVIAVGGTEDHVHLLLNLNKNISLAQLIEKVKKSSSKWIKLFSKNYPDINLFYWQRGYGAFSVSQSRLEDVKRYINNQKQHHQEQGFKDELRKFLKHYSIPYQEEYVWD